MNINNTARIHDLYEMRGHKMASLPVFAPLYLITTLFACLQKSYMNVTKKLQWTSVSPKIGVIHRKTGKCTRFSAHLTMQIDSKTSTCVLKHAISPEMMKCLWLPVWCQKLGCFFTNYDYAVPQFNLTNSMQYLQMANGKCVSKNQKYQTYTNHFFRVHFFLFPLFLFFCEAEQSTGCEFSR